MKQERDEPHSGDKNEVWQIENWIEEEEERERERERERRELCLVSHSVVYSIIQNQKMKQTI